MKKRIIIFVLAIIFTFSCIMIVLNKKTDEKYYSLKDDNIISITNVVGKRNLTYKSKRNYGDTIIKTYKYNKISNPYNDLSKYIMYLEGNSNFINTKGYDLNKEKGNIELSRYSTNKEYIIIMDIKYNKNSYTIKITRGKGKIDILNNS